MSQLLQHTELLLLSNSRMPGRSIFEHVKEVISDFASGLNAVFLPFAGVTLEWPEYTAIVQRALKDFGIQLQSLHEVPNQRDAIDEAELIVVGGGNTFHLLAECRRRHLLEPIRNRVGSGHARYLGWSAGSNLACPTIRTTNDMPVIDPGGFGALDLIDFQLNPHYTNAVIPGHGGESRDERIAEFLLVNPDERVLGLPEGTWLEVKDRKAVLKGAASAPLFAFGRNLHWLKPGEAVPGNVTTDMMASDKR